MEQRKGIISLWVGGNEKLRMGKKKRFRKKFEDEMKKKSMEEVK